MKKRADSLTVEKILKVHAERGDEIRRRLSEFRTIAESGTDEQLWEEMVFCFFTGGCSARMGLSSVEAVRHLLGQGSLEEIASALKGVHRYPNARSRYIIHTRNFLLDFCELKLSPVLRGFSDAQARRDWLVREKGIKGLGYKESSHFLRNIGYCGYAILDKHVLRSLFELGFIEDPKPPNTRSKYLRVEESFGKLADATQIDFDELDLVLWSMKTGVILK